MSSQAASPPVLVYDGECGFCRYTVGYARAVTGAAVCYRSYQHAAGDYPEVPLEQFRASIQLFEARERHAGAAAALRTLALGGRGGWLWCHQHLPGFAALAEWLYRWVAAHRGGCLKASRLLIGPELRPASHGRTAGLLIRGISVCSLLAFMSLWWQVQALYGPEGVLPAGRFLDAVASQWGWQRLLELPSLLWLDSSVWTLHTLCAAGCLAAVVALSGRFRATALLAQYLCYLSLFHAGQAFLGYQWDALLLECLVVAALLARAPGPGIWVARLVLLRFMFLSGFVKLASGDPGWWSGTALTVHFETQPLPTVFAWYAHHLPGWLLVAASWLTLVIELAVPWLIITTRRLRRLALWPFLGLELMILLTGNYNFFNLLTLVLCLSLLDDADLPRPAHGSVAPASRTTRGLATALITLGLLQTVHQLRLLPEVVRPMLAIARPLVIANPYGLFAVMTTRRDELIIEGTRDGETWLPYGFPFKPGDVDVRPRWATPHQPRLDWQMWFAALEGPDRSDWIYELVDALLQARPPVLALLQDPFAGDPPQAIRIIRYRYRFSTPAERAESGAWWVRDQRLVWLRPMKLRTPVIRHQPLVL